MSHEIRTPLNGILSATELLSAVDTLSAPREYLEINRTSGETLLAVVNDILDFSKVEAGRLELEHVPFSLGKMLSGLLPVFRINAARKPLEVRCALAPDVPDHLQGDPVRLRQVLMNLVGNALKFTERGEVVLRIGLEIERDDAVVLRFAVSDTGIGIPRDRLQTLFSPFVEGDSSMRRGFGGTGLGLAISRRLVTLMQGETGVSSELGGGSEFWFTATFGGAAAADSGRLPAAGPAAPDAETLPPGGARILLAEDNPINRTVFLALL